MLHCLRFFLIVAVNLSNQSKVLCSSVDSCALLLLQNHYPERLAQLWFLNAPGIFWGLWKMVSPFIDAGTREKISFVKGEAALADLKKVIPAEVGETFKSIDGFFTTV
jgi:CRAL/TRIO domain